MLIFVQILKVMWYILYVIIKQINNNKQKNNRYGKD